jgi:hypothetical protein
MNRQKPTNPDISHYSLSPHQETGVDLLAAGTNLTDTAASLGVNRQTISEWVNHNPAFRAVLNQRRQELWAEASDKLRGLLPHALALLERAVKEGNLKAAIAVLRSAGLEHLPPPHGSTDPGEIETADKEVDAARALRTVLANSKY